MSGRVWGLALALMAFLPAATEAKKPQVASPTPTATAVAVSASGRDVFLLTVNGMINPAVADYLEEGIEEAHERDAQALILQLDTPGGSLESTKVIVKAFLGAPLPVVVYVAPSGSGATSAGVFVTLAAHVAAMAPGTNIGAAHPVSAGGGDIEGDMREKVENFAASLIRTIAEKRGRNVEWAEKAVRKSVSITEREAVREKVVDLLADNLSDLLVKLDGRRVEVNGRVVVLATKNATVVRHSMRFRQKILNVLANPMLAYLLLMGGMLGLYVEFTHPGVFFPGVAGAICLLLAFAALQILPVNYSGLALIFLGVALLASELFLPSFGVLGIGGITAFVFGSMMLFDTPNSTLSLNLGVIIAVAGTFAAFTIVVGWLVVRAQRAQPSLGEEGMVGEIGEVRRAPDARGRIKVFVHGEYWNAESEGGVAVGDAVEVVAVDGLRMRVRRVPEANGGDRRPT